MPVVALVQPYLPAYRVPLFGELARLLDSDGIELRVITGTPTPEQAARGDAVEGQPWQTTVRSHHAQVAGRWVRTHRAWRSWSAASAVVTELAAGLADTYVALAGRKPVGVWGHVTRADAGLESRAIEWQVRRADHVFAYTSAGARCAETMGANPARITVVNNAVDTVHLRPRADPENIDPMTFGFLGALDETKRLDLVVRVVERWLADGTPATLLVGGDGPGRHLLADPRFEDHVRMLGRVDDEAKAQLLNDASMLLCPGRIGLVALDSLAAAVPIVTTNSPLHAPEFDYLTPGRNCEVAKSDETYADLVISLALDPARLSALRDGCRRATVPTIEMAAENMRVGIQKLAAGSEGRRS